MDKHLTLRIVLDIALFLAVIFGWWYVALPLGLILVWAFPWYAELVAAGFIYDALFGMNRGLGVLGFMGLFAALILFAIATLFKVVVRW